MRTVVVVLAAMCALMMSVTFAAAFSATACHSVTLHFFSVTSDAEIEAALVQRSTPSSPLFRQHMTLPQLTRLVRADDDVLTAVLSAYPDADISVTRDSAVVNFCGALSIVAKSLHRLHVDPAAVIGAKFAHKVRLAYVTVPAAKTRGVRGGAQGQFPGVNQDPNTIRVRYNIPNTTVPSPKNTSLPIPGQAVAEFEQEQFYYSNVVTFGQRYGGVEVNVSVVGPNNGGYFGEGNLDLQYIVTLAQGSPTWWVELSEFDMTGWTERFLTVKPLPTVASISWGSGSSGFQFSDMESDSLHFQKLGLLGVTVLAAAGDVGTGSTGFFSCGTFDSNWPASSPYVTAVGATYTNATIGGPEIAWSGSGGGFSAYFNRTSWQASAVAAYLASPSVTLPPPQFWNRTGRAVPDVAAVGTNFEVYSYGWGTETGTSAATPTFAAIITRINADRLAKGLPTLGFINPKLYELGRVGFDVTEGDNRNPSCPAGFQAAVGWDPITGLGTPDYQFLAAHI